MAVEKDYRFEGPYAPDITTYAEGGAYPERACVGCSMAMGSTWSYLDITALGRQEEWEDSPEGYPQTPPYRWWNYHDAYGDAA